MLFRSTYSKVSGPGWLSISPDGTLGGTPANANAGLNSFMLQVTDGKEVDEAVLRIQVIDTPSDFEWWQHQHFDDYEISRGLADGTEDPDADGLDNWREYIFCSDPLSGKRENAFLLQTVSEAGQVFAELSYCRRDAYSGLTYSLLQSPDLVDWSTVPGEA